MLINIYLQKKDGFGVDSSTRNLRRAFSGPAGLRRARRALSGPARRFAARTSKARLLRPSRARAGSDRLLNESGKNDTRVVIVTTLLWQMWRGRVKLRSESKRKFPMKRRVSSHHDRPVQSVWVCPSICQVLIKLSLFYPSFKTFLVFSRKKSTTLFWRCAENCLKNPRR